ncbi:MAG: helix-turn-helix domain-containing protein [Clostridia bacterium]|nr:helix-turn-helix domain-containing protein [Clostridia bacterium]MBQ9785775.1 helix-turn-helix domain-containing protein [Clostridia bacterium]
MKVYHSENLMKDDASLHIFKMTETQEQVTHVHDFIEIVYVLRGSAVQTVNGESYRVRRGDLLFINYGSTHAFVPEGDYTYINICFKPEVLSESVITPENAFAVLQLTAFDEIRRASDEDGMVSYHGQEREEIEHVMHTMLREYTERRHGWRTVLRSYMNVLIFHILRRVVSADVEAPTDDVWKQLSDYIDENPDGDLSLDFLAGKCFYNPSYFSRAFKKRFNMPLSEYLNRRRIARAMELSRDGRYSDEEIAAAVGFSYKSSFYRVFQRLTGKTFAQYKREKGE